VRIKSVKEGVDSEGIEIIQDPVDIQKHAFRLIQRAKEEILIMISTPNAFHRQEREGGIQLLNKAATERGVKIRILTPEDEQIVETARKLMLLQEGGEHPHENIDIRYVRPHLQTGILIVDKKYSLAVEVRDDTKQTSLEAIGLATYSNSQSTVLSYASIFETLWTQTELYQKLRESEKVKDDFVRIAAHELRTPIQPILGLAEILRSKETDDGQKAEYLDVIIRNAKRLQRLTQDILDISKIESKSLDLKKESFNLNEMILIAITDSNNQLAKEHGDNLKLKFTDPKKGIFIKADKGRINQVISNLLSNASGEAARRYYSAKQFLYSGVPHVYLPQFRTPLLPFGGLPRMDLKFFDLIFPFNIWYVYTNQPLGESLGRFVNFPIVRSKPT